MAKLGKHARLLNVYSSLKHTSFYYYLPTMKVMSIVVTCRKRNCTAKPLSAFDEDDNRNRYKF